MSYCRFSSDDFKCDVYVYESCHGYFAIHVAGRRVEYREPLPPPAPDNDVAAWLHRFEIVQEIFQRSPMIEIDLPHAGGSFECADAAACADKLVELKNLGYVVPDYVIEELRHESAAALETQ